MTATQIPNIQRAWQVVRRGPPSVGLVLSNDVKVKKPGLGEVLIRVEAAALNPIGYKLMKLLPNILTKRPHVAEGDFTGIVVNGNGTEFKEGDAVLGLLPYPQMDQGALAEYTVAKESQIVHRPSTLSIEEAAGFTLATLTAYEALVKVAKIEESQSIFVNGGSTSIGIAAIQIAKASGCKVTASCSSANVELVKKLGADEVIDYTTGPVHQQLSSRPPTPRFHVIFDAIGSSSELFTHSPAYLAPSGLYMLLGSGIPSTLREWISSLSMMFNISLRPRWLGRTKRNSKFLLLNPTKENLKSIAKLAEEGKLRSLVDSVYSFDDALKAYDRIMTSRAKGKVVVKVA